MDINHLIDLIKELPQDSRLQYVRGNDVCVFHSIDTKEPRIFARTPAGKDISFAGSYIKNMALLIEKNVPFNVSQLMNNSGSNRPVIETVVAHTKEFYRYNKGNAIYVVWIPDFPHEIGGLANWTDDSMIKESLINVGSTKMVSKLIIDLGEGKTYSEEELVQILREMYKAGEEDYSRTANLLLFSLKYGEYIGNVKALCNKAGIPLPTAVSDGKRLYNLIKEQKYGMAFYSPNIDIEVRRGTNNVYSPDSHQIIYYGAPGTGKSHKIKTILGESDCYTEDNKVSKENIFRTTFHPDSDYSTFVGAYKPTMKKQYRYEGKVKATYYEDDDLAGAKKGEPVIEKVIEYKYIPQAFLNAYIRAYQTKDNVYLIIEEINRGNCAQIFGDLFQLLDRDANGVSEYKIKADSDLRAYIEEILGVDNKGIKDGELCLPSNLYIYATMNTSDQSLFPIDSAFKRRWDWEYVPIKYKNKDWVIDIQGYKYSWISFQKIINNKIFNATNSEDKMLGDYFVNPNDGVITEKMLLNKVLFYLWNDVCKDGDGDLFKISETEDVTFSELYSDESKQKLIDMFDYLGIDKTQSEDLIDEEDEEDSNDLIGKKHLKVMFADGSIINSNNSTSTFIQAINKIGPKKVAEIGIKISGFDLVSKHKITEDEDTSNYAYSQKSLDEGYNVITKSSTNIKQKQLQQISDELRLNLTITIE